MPISVGEKTKDKSEDMNEKSTMLSQINTALAQIATDRATLAGSPTTQQLIAILDRVLNRQDKEIRAIRALIRSKES